ncbi:Protein AH9.4 [Aphelenchoides avenae]|nr:Protein AH9.4 [Aphelenchus avenae]
MTIILNLSRQPITYKRLQVGKKRNEMLRRSLFISALNLLCNLPSHALRALWSLDGGEQVIPERWMMFFEGVSQLLYFGQFTCNAFYLSTTIYETSTVPMRPYTINSSAPGTGTTTNGGNTFRSLISDDV